MPGADLEWPRIATHVTSAGAALAALRALPAPFLAVHEVDAGRVVSDRFVGVSVARAVQVLKSARRRLPLDVWLHLVDRLLGFYEALPPEHLLWMTWQGPHALGVDLRGRVTLFATRGGSPVPAWVSRPNEEDLHTEWADLRPEARAHVGAPLAAVCKALIWMLDPHPFERLNVLRLVPPQPARPWDGRWAHPQVPQALADVLNAGVERTADERGTVASLRAAVLAAAGVSPASEARVGSVLFGVGQRDLVAGAQQLLREPTSLPRSWRDDGLLVEIDRLLEGAAPLADCPLEAGASAGPEGRLFVVVPTTSLQLEVSDQSGVVHRTSIGLMDARLTRVAVPLASRRPAGTPFTVELRHPAIAEARVVMEGLSDPRGWVELREVEAEKRPVLEHLWGALREAEAGFQVQAPPTPTAPPPAPRVRHPVPARRSHSRGIELAAGMMLGCAGGLFVSVLVAVPLAALCLFGVLPWKSMLWLFGLVAGGGALMGPFLSGGPDDDS